MYKTLFFLGNQRGTVKGLKKVNDIEKMKSLRQFVIIHTESIMN